MHLECPLLLKPTFDMRQANDGFVPSFASVTALQGNRKPMNECPELASAERALSVHKWSGWKPRSMDTSPKRLVYPSQRRPY